MGFTGKDGEAGMKCVVSSFFCFILYEMKKYRRIVEI